ncbi:hypothetical protein P43SY_003974 [Pythium insidiosum]|uniref:Glycosyl transferase CAP10 domain-containing protein n=1 Tax=Pythium insidiosum TaxID=114742 RepID=A0AAD5QBV3_PYTIN|nr:hypothetical protein P43SY_003974 [Pythium insidiosum]
MDDRPTLRGIFAFEDEETSEWRRVVLSEGSGGLPKFATKSECEDFVRRHCWRGSNPEHPHLQHVISTLVDWRQIQDVLLSKMDEYDQRFPAEAPAELSAQNRFLHHDGTLLTAGVDARLNLPFHQRTNRESTMNTLKYLFHQTRCGVFVMIRRRHVVLFVPFANKDAENRWGDRLEFDSVDGSQQQYFRGALEDACMHRNIPDCEFFINKQAYPHLKESASEPFGFLFDRDDADSSQDLPLARHDYPSHAPVLSMLTSKRYADVPFPSAVDWETATGLLFPQSFQHSHCDQCPCGDAANCENMWECYCDVGENERKPHGIEPPRDLFSAANFRKHHVPWEEKQETAFFRGRAAGGGADAKSNQRLHLAQLSLEWQQDTSRTGRARNGGRGSVPLLDAALTDVPPHDVKLAGKPVQFMRPDDVAAKALVGREHFVPLAEQSRFKYVLYVDGTSASRRYSALLRLGSVILKVESTAVASDLWFSSLLRPFEDHVPIRADLSDLEEKIQWCRQHDAECQAIAARAAELYEQYLSKDALHDYVEMVCNRIAERFRPAPLWYHRPKGVDTLKKPMLYRPRSLCVTGANARHCRRCRELVKENEARERERRDSGGNRGDLASDTGRSSHYRSSYNNGDRGGGHDRGREWRSNESSYRPRNDRNDDRSGGGGSRFRDSRGDHHHERDPEPSSPKRQKANVVPQCRRCRRAKSACTCSYRR